LLENPGKAMARKLPFSEVEAAVVVMKADLVQKKCGPAQAQGNFVFTQQ
jgi:hypothetical protein